MTRPITFLSDYGTADEFAGVCRAVVARIAPEARVIDLTHGIARHDVRQGAAVLESSLRFAPSSTLAPHRRRSTSGRERSSCSACASGS